MEEGVHTATTNPCLGGKERGVGKSTLQFLSYSLSSCQGCHWRMQEPGVQSEEVGLPGAEQGGEGWEWTWGQVPA